MDMLGRYYTADAISALLIDNLETKAPHTILDLGVGDASLTRAAYAKWSTAKYFGTEIEQHKANLIKKRLTFLKVFKYDTLLPNASNKLKVKFGTIDIAICNPPYIPIENKKKYYRLFKTIGCDNFRLLKRITSEIVFLAHNLKLLKEDGELAIIVSDSIVTGKEFQIFRETILKEFDVRRIIQLPDKVFNKTEARTHILFISKAKSFTDFCEILMSNERGILSEKLLVKKDELAFRMDYKFFNDRVEHIPGLKTLSDIGATIKRGNFSYKELKESGIQFFHSIHLNESKPQIIFTNTVSETRLDYAAIKGDILMCRVGKGIVGRVAIIKAGNIIHSDCIYRIRVDKKYQKIVLNSLKSVNGKRWLHAYAHGVCSQVISKSDLLNFPLFCLEV
jgi:tRNA1(Val) A37 N6-methylase TrmN6